MPPAILAANWATTIEGSAVPKASSGKISESAVAPRTLEPLARTDQERPSIACDKRGRPRAMRR